MAKISITLSQEDFGPGEITFFSWRKFVSAKLKEAGVPVSDELMRISHGILQRFDNPANFGQFTYVWEDDENSA